MRRYFVAILALGLPTSACKTVMKAQSVEQSEIEMATAYDGAADSIDSLPDCISELAGSLFWVRSDKAGYTCSTSGEWTANRDLAAPPSED